MSELRQHWNKLQQFLSYLPPYKRGIAVLSVDQKIVHGGISKNSTDKQNYFTDCGMAIGDLQSAYKYLSQKYDAKGMTVIRSEEFLELITDTVKIKDHGASTEAYHCQLQMLRRALGLSKNEKTDFVKHIGVEPAENFWPREHFFLEIFSSMFADLLPEKKILFLNIVKEDPYAIDSVVLEFQGADLKGFTEPDWAGFDWVNKKKDYFHPDFVTSIMQWCENRYVLPTYAVVCSEDTWNRCRELQIAEGSRAAWKHFLKMKTIRDIEREVTIVPEPWPLTAALYWKAKRKQT